MIAYLDNSATTPLRAEAREAMISAMEHFGNPSSLHTLGVEAEHLVSDARKTILSTLGVPCRSSLDGAQLIFTASGTEADNLAILGSIAAKDFAQGKKIITTATEHPAVLEPMKVLEKRGFRVVRVPCPHGVPDYDMIEAEADRDTVLVSVMLVNNETGAAYDVKRISDIVKRANKQVIVHTDCVQGYLKRQFTARSLGADMITLSAHKIGGPKGVGALWVSGDILRQKKLVPIIHGGGQERGMRSGTENVIGIAGFAAAARAGFATLSSDLARMSELRRELFERIERLASDERLAGIRANIPDADCAPNILSLTIPGIRSETLLHSLSASGVYVSSGSACSSNTGHGSYVLADFGLAPSEVDSTVRVSLSPSTTEAELELLADALVSASAALVRTK